MNTIAPLLRGEIGRRLLFTVGVLLIYRLGIQVPLPGLSGETIHAVTRWPGTGVASVFSLALPPVVSVLFLFELIKLIVPPLSRWETSEASHAQTLVRIVYLLALVLAGFQARGVTNALQDIPSLMDGPVWAIVIPLT